MKDFKTYLVGGAVRDQLLGLEPKDLDYVVVGATPSDMIAMGYTQVGADFPVFLHPTTKDEYALARIEKKEGDGYNGFTCETAGVTLEDDLARRDLTINAMAMDDEGNVIDPFGGMADLAEKRLQHVGPAFAEDPVRVLRVARFCARGFQVTAETKDLMTLMTERGDLDHLTPERVWAETAKTLTESKPWMFFALLGDIGALQVVMPEVNDSCCGLGDGDLSINFTKYIHNQRMDRDTLDSFCQRLKVPNELRDLARIGIQVEKFIKSELSILRLFETTDAFRKPAVFKAGLEPIVGHRLFGIVCEWLDGCIAINVKSLNINPSITDGKAIGEAINGARRTFTEGRNIDTIL